MKKIVLAVLLASAFCIPAFATCLDFSCYPATSDPQKLKGKVKIEDADTRMFRTSLREAARRPPDFAGHYVLATIGCGMSCESAAAIDAETGKVIWFPFSVLTNFYDNTDIDRFRYQPDSRLLIVRGTQNESGHYGTYYYNFDGKEFRLLHETPLQCSDEDGCK